MNKLTTNIVILLFLLIGITACNDNENAQVVLSTREVSVNANGGSTTFRVQTLGDWTIETDGQTWYSVTPMQGSGATEVIITIEPSTESNGRSANLIVRCGSSNATLAITQTNITEGEDTGNQQINIRARGGDKEINLPTTSNEYDVVIPTEATWISIKEKKKESVILSFAANSNTDQYRTAEIIVNTTSGTKVATLDIKQSWRNIEPGELLIEEIFFSGNLIQETGKLDKANGEQYFRLTNNTDETLYADGVIIGESLLNTSSTTTFNETYDPDIRPEAAPVQALYVIPGNGTQYPLEAHQSIVIVNNAQNHKANNPTSFDLSKADFEWYNESTVSSMQDIDNPDVPNLDIWEANTSSVWILDNAGRRGYVIAQIPSNVSKDDFLSNEKYLWSYTRKWTNSANKEFSVSYTNKHVIPNAWVLDAVNLGPKDDYNLSAFDASLDAGYTYCGTTASDTNRYGKSVRRKKVDDKLVDTNNSTNDFETGVVPSMAQ